MNYQEFRVKWLNYIEKNTPRDQRFSLCYEVKWVIRVWFNEILLYTSLINYLNKLNKINKLMNFNFGNFFCCVISGHFWFAFQSLRQWTTLVWIWPSLSGKWWKQLVKLPRPHDSIVLLSIANLSLGMYFWLSLWKYTIYFKGPFSQSKILVKSSQMPGWNCFIRKP